MGTSGKRGLSLPPTKLVVVAKPSQFAEPAGRLRSRKVMHKAASKRFYLIVAKISENRAFGKREERNCPLRTSSPF